MADLISVSDYIRGFFEKKGVKHIFLLSGGMMMNLLDSISRSESIRYVCNHHEQACAIAAEAYARVKNDIGVCYATSGPGATNTVTGIAGAWLDSSPVIYLTGQSRTTLTVRGSGIKNLRMIGNFEVDITEIVKPITKYTAFVDKAGDIAYHLERAYYTALEGRPGPVLLDIPLDIQGAMINEEDLRHFELPAMPPDKNEEAFQTLYELLKNSTRPVFLAGHGIRVANQADRFNKLIAKWDIPVLTTQLANDLIAYDDEHYIGKVGLRGDRAGNYAVQNADLVITLGCSLHITTTGYETESFAPMAKIVSVDIDPAVLEKNSGIVDFKIQCDISTFLDHAEKFDFEHSVSLIAGKDKVDDRKGKVEHWKDKLLKRKELFPIKNEPHPRDEVSINTYDMVNVLSEMLTGDEVVVSDAGSLYYIMGQAFKTKKGQRVIISGALGAMGYALPASIGAAFAEPDKNIICLTGDGSMQLNVQELQTIHNYKLNCKIIVINNNGYASIRNSQESFQKGNLAASSADTGVTFPDWKKIADAYSIPYLFVDELNDLAVTLKQLLDFDGPVLLELVVPDKVTMIPAVLSVRLPNGSFKSNSLDEMSPELPLALLDNAGISDL